MTHDEVIDLLTLVAASDKRTVGQADVEIWHAVANADRWTFALARRALIEHQRHNDVMIKPAHINAIIDAARQRARSKFTEDVSPPRELRDDPRGEIGWRRDRAQTYVEAALDAWSHGEDMPEPEQRDALGETIRPQLSASVPELIDEMAFGRRVPPAGREPTDANDRAERIAQARAELDTLRAVAPPVPDTSPEQPSTPGKAT